MYLNVSLNKMDYCPGSGMEQLISASFVNSVCNDQGFNWITVFFFTFHYLVLLKSSTKGSQDLQTYIHLLP